MMSLFKKSVRQASNFNSLPGKVQSSLLIAQTDEEAQLSQHFVRHINQKRSITDSAFYLEEAFYLVSLKLRLIENQKIGYRREISTA